MEIVPLPTGGRGGGEERETARLWYSASRVASSRHTSTEMSSSRSATGDSVRFACHITQICRGSITGLVACMHSSSSSGSMSTASSGMIAGPSPARTMAITAPLSRVRNTVTGRTPSAPSLFSMRFMSHDSGNATICSPSSTSTLTVPSGNSPRRATST